MNTCKNNSISIVVPAFNEADTINQAIDLALELGNNWKDFEVIVVNDGSVDNTVKVVQERTVKDRRIRLCDLVSNHGRGHALYKGYLCAQKDYVMCLNGKLDTSYSEINKVFESLGKADLVISVMANNYERPLLRRFLSRLYVFILNLFFRQNLKYYNNTLVASRSLVQKYAKPVCSYFFDADLLIRLLKSVEIKNYVEVPIFDRFAKDRKSRAFSIKNIVGVFRDFCFLFIDIYLKKT